MQTALSICMGIGLSAACGFRIFVPLLVMSLASKAGGLELAQGFDWIASTPALIVFATATVLEICAYFIPVFDNLLDTLATPTAVVAGTLITASVALELDPLLRWTLALIAGGGIAGLIQGSTVLTRGASTATTGSLANPLVASAELGGAAITSILALFAPIITAGLVIILACLLVRRLAVGWRRSKVSQKTDG